MKYAKIVDNKVIQVQPNNEAGFVEVGNDVVCGMILENGSYIVPSSTPTQIEENIRNVVQNHLDVKAKGWGYDSIYTAIGYIGDPNAEFNQEGIMFRNWRSAVWTYVNQEMQKVQDGLRTIPATNELIIAELPLLANFE